MRKSLFLTSLALVAALPAVGRSLSPEEALNRALPQVRKISPRARVASSGADVAPVLTMPGVYVFNQADGGALIVSADDVAAPVLGYTDAPLVAENLPENFIGWLESLSNQIELASEAGVEAYTSARQGDMAPIEPLMSTKWDQTSPFNNDTPNHWPTGCVATAMAQVMKYHNWPAQAADNAVFSYVNSGTTLSANFSNYAFAWDDMLDSYQQGYTPEQASAVAKLMQACGYSVQMKYASVASGAVNQIAGAALANYFKYDQGLHNEPREAYTTADWESMLYENLRDCGPVIYWGGIHCFVCDGYQGDGYFHFNWGWAGSGDGYFLIDALNPKTVGTGGNAAGYNSEQGALFGIKPAGATPSPRHYTFYHSLEISSVETLSNNLSMKSNFINYSPFDVTAENIYQIYNEDGSEYIASVPCNPSSSLYQTMLSHTLFSGTIPGTYVSNPVKIDAGTYRIYPAVKVDGTEYVFKCPPSVPEYVIYTREKQGSSFVNSAKLPDVGQKVIRDLSTNGDFYIGQTQIKITGIAEFTGDATASMNVTCRLLSPTDNSQVAIGDNFTIQFTPNGGTPFEALCAWFNTWDIDPGEYIFALSYTNTVVSTSEYFNIATCPVKVNAYTMKSSYKATDFSVDKPAAVDPDDIKLSVAIEAVEGYANEALLFRIFDFENGTVWEGQYPLYVTAPGSTVVNATAKLPDAIPGATYSAKVLRQDKGTWVDLAGPVDFIIAKKNEGTTALTEVRLSADKATITTPDPITAITIHNLQGQQINAPIQISANTAQITLTPGLYICTIQTPSTTQTLKLHLN